MQLATLDIGYIHTVETCMNDVQKLTGEGWVSQLSMSLQTTKVTNNSQPAKKQNKIAK